MCCGSYNYWLKNYCIGGQIKRGQLVFCSSLSCGWSLLCRVLQNGLYREYSPSNRQLYSSTITVSKTVYDPDATQQQQQMVSASSASPRLQASPRSTLDRRTTGLANSPSLVSGNLSELDTLLDDLNTSTKMYSTSTMERRAAGLTLLIKMSNI